MRGQGIVFAVLGAAALLCQGCGPEIRDPATGIEADYDWDTLEAELDRPIWAVYPAAREVAHEFGLEVFREAEDGISAEIIALDAQRERVDITLGALPGSRTELCIQVGFGGDRNKSIVLFESIVAKSSRQGWVTAVSPAPQGAQGGGPSGER